MNDHACAPFISCSSVGLLLKTPCGFWHGKLCGGGGVCVPPACLPVLRYLVCIKSVPQTPLERPIPCTQDSPAFGICLARQLANVPPNLYFLFFLEELVPFPGKQRYNSDCPPTYSVPTPLLITAAPPPTWVLRLFRRCLPAATDCSACSQRSEAALTMLPC